MSEISRDDVVAVFGPVSDAVAAEIIATGATSEQLAAAHAWIARDEAGTITDRALLPGPMTSIVEIVERVKQAGKYPITGSPFGESGSTLK